MAIDLKNLEFRLSGGAANSNISNSRGGAISNTEIVFRTYTQPSNITGVTVVNSFGTASETDTMYYTNSGTTLKWKTGGDAVDVSADGRYFLNENAVASPSTGLVVDVVSASLPGTDQNDSITVSGLVGNLYEQVTKSEKILQSTEYIGIYVINTDVTDSFIDFKLWSNAPTSGDAAHQFALASEGINGTMETLADEYTAPTAISFANATSEGTAIGPITLGPGDYHGIWISRQALSTTPNNTTLTADLLFRVDF